MKTLLFFLLFPLTASGQLFITLEPGFLRPGVMYTVGPAYAHVWHGDIRGDGDFYTKNVKIGAGYALHVDHVCTVYFGPNWQRFYDTNQGQNRAVNLNSIREFSVDIGGSFRMNRTTLLFMTDFPNWESMIGLSYRFSSSKYSRSSKITCKELGNRVNLK